jgi:hypothetical protein
MIVKCYIGERLGESAKPFGDPCQRTVSVGIAKSCKVNLKTVVY